MKKFLAIVGVILSFPLYSLSYVATDYYFCNNETFKTGWDYDFTFQQRNGTRSNPYVYDPNQPSREYIYFYMSSYPMPSGYIAIKYESDKEIFIQGIYGNDYTDSKKEEYFTFVINKIDVSFKGTVINYKNEKKEVASECRKNRF